MCLRKAHGTIPLRIKVGPTFFFKYDSDAEEFVIQALALAVG